MRLLPVIAAIIVVNHCRFLEAQRVAHLATADAHGRPHVVPVSR